MKRRTAFIPARRLRKAGAAGLCALWLLLSFAAVSPALHHWLHDRGDRGHVCEDGDDGGGAPGNGEEPHLCAVVFLQSGVLPVAPVAVPVPTAVPEARPSFCFILKSGSGSPRTADARAPPRSSVV